MSGSVRFVLGAACLAAVWALVASCSGSPLVCTQVGCQSGLVVEVNGTIPDSITVSVQSPTVSHPFTVTCATAECARHLFIADYTPTTVHVEVHGEGVDIATDVEPTYQDSRPNGEDCPPRCRVGTVQVDAG